jgi:hypothetical protein
VFGLIVVVPENDILATTFYTTYPPAVALLRWVKMGHCDITPIQCWIYLIDRESSLSNHKKLAIEIITYPMHQ